MTDQQPQPLVSIVIPTLVSDLHMLQSCLTSLNYQTMDKELFEVILVVNGPDLLSASEEHKLTKLARYQLHILKLDRNYGFAGGTNAGFRLATGRYLVTLNDDTLASSMWLDNLVQTAQDSNKDMVASVIYKIDCSQTDELLKQQQHGLTATLIPSQDLCLDSAGFNFLMQGRAPVNLDLKQEPFGVDAAAGLFSRELIAHVDMFDESFFAYLEDVDLAYRAVKKGFKAVIAPQATVYHLKHHSSEERKMFISRQNLINWWRLIIKNYDWQDWRRYWFSILLERTRNIKGYCRSLISTLPDIKIVLKIFKLKLDPRRLLYRIPSLPQQLNYALTLLTLSW